MSHVGGNLWGVRLIDDNGRVLNAEFAVESGSQGLSVVLESAGGVTASGPGRNSDYTPALELILGRLRALDALLVDALVDSQRTEHLAESERRVLDRPVRLSSVDDLAAFRLHLTSRQGRIAQAPGARKAGNNRKRLRLRVEVAGYGVTDGARLAAGLVGEAVPDSATPQPAEPVPAPRQADEPGAVRLNEWWRDDPAECYWLEITDRDDLGANVQALQRDGSGRENWSYALVTALRPGDIVLHWHKSQQQTPGIVGYSRAIEGPFEDELVWHARGTYGQARRVVKHPQPSWRYELAGYTPLATPVDQTAFQRTETRLREIKQELEGEHTGPLYFPFAFYNSRPVRVMQAYLVKFPAAILDAVPELSMIPRARVAQPVFPLPSPASQPRKARPHGSGYLADPILKRAIERHAVRRAMDLYAGYDVQDVGDELSYDLLVANGSEKIHVEVKGSSGVADKVELTRNEVQNARDADTHLVVVDQIVWKRLPSGEIETQGGRVRRWTGWMPQDERLEVTRYRYLLPEGGSERLEIF